MISFRKKLGLFAVVLLSFGFALIFAGGFSGEVFAHTVTLSTSGTVNLEVSPAGIGNSNGASLGVDTLEVTSTCPLGYTVTISGPTDSTLYKNGESTNNATNQKITASTGTSTSPASILGDNLGTWGYALGVNPTTGESTNITTSSNFIGLNSTNTTLITKSSASGDGDEVTTDTYPVYYGTSVSSAHEPGLYKLAESSEGAADNVITYYLTTNANCNTYKIRYNDNGANSTTKMSDQNVNLSSDLTLWASNFKYPDSTNTYANSYGFAGWSLIQLDPNANDFKTKLAAAVNAGKVYGPNQTIAQADLQSFVDNNITVIDNNQYVVLYAIWVKSEGNIQAWQGCDSMNTGDITALKDTRDNNVYAIAKLADGKCWMIENLRLADKRSDNTAITLNKSNTNYPLATFTQLGVSTEPVAAAWCDSANAACYDKSMVFSGSTMNAVANMSDANSSVYSYGNYYNWYSATTGYGTYSRKSGVATSDICPSGWHLPTGTNNGEFYGLYNIINTGANFRKHPNNYVISGIIQYSGINYNVGTYWTPNALSGSTLDLYASSLSIHQNNVMPDINPNVSAKRTIGKTIRCVMSAPAYQVEFNANGGTRTMSAQTVPRDVATALTTNTFTRTNYAFTGWNTAADGSGTSYANKESVTNIAPLFGSITLYAQWGCPANRVCYDDNGANSSTKMSNQTIASTATTINFWPSNFQRAGYGFAGWSTEKLDADAANFQTKLTAAKNAGHVYGPMETITITAGQYSTLGLQLYAIWVPSAGNLQGWTGCSSLATGAVTALKDTRDNNVYAVAKLADNKCWMIENLRLADKTANNTTIELSSTNTNNPSLPLTNTWWTNADNDSDTPTTSNSLSSPVTPSSTTPWCTANNANCIDQSMLATNNTSSAVTNQSNNSSNIYSYGNYYNWYSATAGNGKYGATNNNTSVGGDLCPAGWHLPKGGDSANATNSDLWQLGLGIMGTAPSNNNYYQNETNMDGKTATLAIMSFPNNFLYSGLVDGSSVRNRGSIGFYWSSTATNSNYGYYAHSLNLYSSYVYLGTVSSNKGSGYTVRCLAGS